MSITKIVAVGFACTLLNISSLYSMDEKKDNSTSQSIPEILAKLEVDAYEKYGKKRKRPLTSEDLAREYKRVLEIYSIAEEKLPFLEKGTKPFFDDINYSMTLEEIKDNVQAKFVKMNSKGLIISKEEFENIKDN